MTIPWTQHVRNAHDLLVRAFEIANRVGDITYACYAVNRLHINLLMAGGPLSDMQKEVENGLEFAQKARFGLVVGTISGHLALIRMLRGLTVRFGSFNCAEFDEQKFEDHLSNNPALGRATFWYWTRKLQACFLAGDYAAALDAAARAQPMLGFSLSPTELPEFHFYRALGVAASCDSASPQELGSHLEALVAHHKQLEAWAKIGLENFENRAFLVGAEVARIQGRELDAERLYEAAIKSARKNEFVHNEGLANELAARFHATRGFETIARAYLREARSCYQRWGAEGKVRQLETLHPYLRDDASAAAAVGTTEARLEQLDFATVLKVSQAVSSEIVLERLIDTLMRTAIEQAGAQRGLLIIPHGAEPRIAAEAITKGDSIVVTLKNEAIAEAALPASVLQYVLRTHESVVIDDAATKTAMAADPYVSHHKARSILCLPLLNQAKLIGALFLDNHLAPGVFAPDRITVLRLVASQAAIALDNSRLYGDLHEREAKIRRLVDANIIGILIVDLGGEIIEANDAFLRIVGYEREDLVSGHLRWTDLTPPDWRVQDAERVEELHTTGALQAIEKEYFRKDGGRVPVLVGMARFDETGNQAITFAIDLTERKRAESEALENERRFREAQMQLAHAGRVTTMGQLTASIAHEVNQPITATIGNAEAALRWLARQPPDLAETRQLLGRIVKDGRRASNVVGRIRDLTKKAPPRIEPMDINGAISEVIELTRGEAMKNGVSVQMQLAERLPLVEADRIQLQQVLLNLMLNAIQALEAVAAESRELLISSSKNEPSSVAISVRDSGPGLSSESISRLFDPFYTTKPDGMGMGLSICQSIIESHGGRIWATANVPNGATFHFTIPEAQ
jgi:PAS domain S-box-containing protein